MTEYERIKCLIDEAMRLQEEKCCRCSIDDIAQFLVDNGVIAPPVELGSYVYHINSLFTTFVDEHYVYGVFQKYCGERLTSGISTYNLDNGLHRDFYFDDLGKSIFLTQAEAEEALKEREQNANN